MIWEVTSFLILVLGASAADYYATTSAPPKPQLWLGTWLSTGEGVNMDAVVTAHGLPDVFLGNPMTTIKLTKCPCSLDGLMIERSYENTKTYEKGTNVQAFKVGEQFVSWWPVFNSDLRILYLDSGHKLDVFYEIISRYNQPGFESIQANDTHLHVSIFRC
ncbi:hypothetical protein BV898_09423 [Hypsibius exemplaris]|uniref:Uncharacterized protein n=1 Tax=Hypsibius exemplaris TaxID=2072580 RepID=A0A1W0WMM9_HYPEX|nr:hypothetical protein BV898_09423 [Hypsibius exemplaris]